LIERGRSNPSLDAASAIAEALEIPLSKLVIDAEKLLSKGESAK
jgi:transcriptional regulator with XRE-family HTH domain